MVCVVKDSMILIHLAKMSILETCCTYFEKVIIPELVYDETVKNKEKYEDSFVIRDIIKRKLIFVKKVSEPKFIEKINQYNIQGGEAESIALYIQEKADLLATDDDNVRRKKELLKLRIVGTPAILLKLYRKKLLTKEKTQKAIKLLKEIGWFHNSILDKIMEDQNE